MHWLLIYLLIGVLYWITMPGGLLFKNSCKNKMSWSQMLWPIVVFLVLLAIFMHFSGAIRMNTSGGTFGVGGGAGGPGGI